jgi:hypothetical protein
MHDAGLILIGYIVARRPHRLHVVAREFARNIDDAIDSISRELKKKIEVM